MTKKRIEVVPSERQGGMSRFQFKIADIPTVLPLGEPLPEGAERWKDAPGLLAAFNKGATIWCLLRPGMLHVRVSSESWDRLRRNWDVFEEAGVDPTKLDMWPETPLAYSYLAVLPSNSRIHRVLWFYTLEQEQGFAGMLYGEKAVWEVGTCSELVMEAGPNDARHKNRTSLELSDAHIEALLNEARQRGQQGRKKKG